MLMHVSPAKTVASMQEHVNTLQDALITQINRLLREGQNTISKNVVHARCAEPHGHLAARIQHHPHPSPSIRCSQRKKVTIDQNLEILWAGVN
jgi:hypothetical protein